MDPAPGRPLAVRLIARVSESTRPFQGSGQSDAGRVDDHLGGRVAVAGRSGADREVFGEVDRTPDSVLAGEVDVGLDKDRISGHELDGIIRDGADGLASAGIEHDGTWGGGEVLLPAGRVVILGQGLACEATLGATAAESRGPHSRHQAGRIPLGNGHGAAR